VSDSSGKSCISGGIVTGCGYHVPSIVCPANIVTTARVAAGGSDFRATVSGHCMRTRGLRLNAASGSSFAVGVTSVGAVARDASWSTQNACSVHRNVNDTQAELKILHASTTTGHHLLAADLRFADARAIADKIGPQRELRALFPARPALVSGRWTITLQTTGSSTGSTLALAVRRQHQIKGGTARLRPFFL